jgi:hypothetical protein
MDVDAIPVEAKSFPTPEQHARNVAIDMAIYEQTKEDRHKPVQLYGDMSSWFRSFVVCASEQWAMHVINDMSACPGGRLQASKSIRAAALRAIQHKSMRQTSNVCAPMSRLGPPWMENPPHRTQLSPPPFVTRIHSNAAPRGYLFI